MPLAPDAPFPKTQGDNIRSKDWNDAITEIIRLDNAKANRSGAETFTGPLTVQGRLGIGTNAPTEQLHTTDRVRAGNLVMGDWPPNAAYQMVGVATLPQNTGINYALLQSAVGGDQGTTFLNSPTTIRLRIGNGDRASVESDGSFIVGWGANPVKFSSAWSGFPDGALRDRAEICNDTGTYKTLMIVGNRSDGGTRRVSVWDRLEVNGELKVNGGPITVSQGHTIKIGVTRPNVYGFDGIRGEPNLWLDAAGTVLIKQGFQARGMDVAERFPAAAAVEAGQVVVYDELAKGVRPCTRAADSTAVGIVSEAPAMLIGLGEGEAPIALCGRVPCWVDADVAPVQAGDLLVSSATPGHAQKLQHGAPGAGSGRVIGKALESLASGRGRILAFVLAA